jgi:amino acid transporter
MDSLKTILLILPAVMFSFDGFLFAASLQNEAKKPSTYKVAAISGVTFITIIYLAVTLFMYLAGNPDVEGGMTIAGAIQGIFPDQD